MSGMSLWQIDETIAQLLVLLDDANADEIEPIQKELERYIGETLPAKVDGYIGIIRQDELIADAAEAESDRLTKIAKARRSRVKWLKDNAKAVMQARGLKRLEGKTGQRLRIQANGGKQALKITNEPLVPDEYRVFTFRLSAPAWQHLQRLLDLASGTMASPILRAMLATAASSIDEAKVRAALDLKCMKCDGNGVIEDSEYEEGELPCKSCGGTGKERVPGAELSPRGESLRVE